VLHDDLQILDMKDGDTNEYQQRQQRMREGSEQQQDALEDY
jgi:hypothetical protein